VLGHAFRNDQHIENGTMSIASTVPSFERRECPLTGLTSRRNAGSEARDVRLSSVEHRRLCCIRSNPAAVGPRSDIYVRPNVLRPPSRAAPVLARRQQWPPRSSADLLVRAQRVADHSLVEADIGLHQGTPLLNQKNAAAIPCEPRSAISCRCRSRFVVALSGNCAWQRASNVAAQ